MLGLLLRRRRMVLRGGGCCCAIAVGRSGLGSRGEEGMACWCVRCQQLECFDSPVLKGSFEGSLGLVGYMVAHGL